VRSSSKPGTPCSSARKLFIAVTNPLRRFTGALQIYGGDFFNVARSEFDPDTLEERPFDIEKAKGVFLAANKRAPF
jgi:hypothetical protein